VDLIWIAGLCPDPPYDTVVRNFAPCEP
jgi:hypothetical protein